MTPLRLSLAMMLFSLVQRPTQVYCYTRTTRSGMLRAREERVHSTTRMSTIAPPRRRTKTRPATQSPKTKRPLEYLMDLTAPRGDNDPFHILLLRETFDQPRITISYVVGQLTYTLGMPENDAHEHATFAKQQVSKCCPRLFPSSKSVYTTSFSPYGLPSPPDRAGHELPRYMETEGVPGAGGETSQQRHRVPRGTWRGGRGQALAGEARARTFLHPGPAMEKVE